MEREALGGSSRLAARRGGCGCAWEHGLGGWQGSAAGFGGQGGTRQLSLGRLCFRHAEDGHERTTIYGPPRSAAPSTARAASTIEASMG